MEEPIGKELDSDKSATHDLRPRVIVLTAILSGAGGLVVSQCVEWVKLVMNENSLAPENNIHIVALEGYAPVPGNGSAASEICTLNPARLKSLGANSDAMKTLTQVDAYAVKLYVKDNLTKVNSKQISTNLLQRLKDERIADCKRDSRPLTTLEVALVVTKPYAYIHKSMCDVLYFPDTDEASVLKVGQIDIGGVIPGSISGTGASSQPSFMNGKYKILKESYTTMNSIQASLENNDTLAKDLDSGFLNIGLKCQFLRNKDFKAKDVDFRKVPINPIKS